VIGAAFVQTGWGKLQHLDSFRAYFEQLGIPLAGLQAPFVAGLELVGGALLVLGLGTRIAAALLSGVMLVAMATAVWPGLESWRALPGTIEAIYFSTFVYLAVHGAGAISFDRLVARRVGFSAALRTQTQE
jgi:putative oxidoreductase